MTLAKTRPDHNLRALPHLRLISRCATHLDKSLYSALNNPNMHHYSPPQPANWLYMQSLYSSMRMLGSPPLIYYPQHDLHLALRPVSDDRDGISDRIDWGMGSQEDSNPVDGLRGDTGNGPIMDSDTRRFRFSDEVYGRAATVGIVCNTLGNSRSAPISWNGVITTGINSKNRPKLGRIHSPNCPFSPAHKPNPMEPPTGKRATRVSIHTGLIQIANLRIQHAIS